MHRLRVRTVGSNPVNCRSDCLEGCRGTQTVVGVVSLRRHVEVVVDLLMMERLGVYQ